MSISSVPMGTNLTPIVFGRIFTRPASSCFVSSALSREKLSITFGERAMTSSLLLTATTDDSASSA